jgi:hypothetical protein
MFSDVLGTIVSVYDKHLSKVSCICTAW